MEGPEYVIEFLLPVARLIAIVLQVDLRRDELAMRGDGIDFSLIRVRTHGQNGDRLGAKRVLCAVVSHRDGQSWAILCKQGALISGLALVAQEVVPFADNEAGTRAITTESVDCVDGLTER